MISATWWETKLYPPKHYWYQVHRSVVRDWAFDGSDQRASKKLVDGWEFNNVEYLDPLKAIVLYMRHAYENVPIRGGDPTVPDISIEPGSTSRAPNKGWTCTVPPKQHSRLYLCYRDADPRYWSGAMLNKDFDLDAGVVVYVLRATPSDLGYTVANGWSHITRDQGALQPYVAIHLPDVTSRGVTYRYALFLPSISAAKDEEELRPTLKRGIVSDGVVSSWKTVSKYTGGKISDYLRRSQFASEAVEEAVNIRVLEGVLMISSGYFSEWWCYEDEVLADLWYRDAAPVGKMRFYAQAHQAAFLPCQGYSWPLTGTVSRKADKMPSVPYDCDLSLWSVGARYTPSRAFYGDRVVRDGAHVTTNAAHDGTKITELGATLTAYNPLRTPILYMITERFSSEFSHIKDTPSDLRVLRATIRRRRASNGSVRGGTCTIVLDPAQDPMPTFKGGEVVTITVHERPAVLDEATGTYIPDAENDTSYTVFTGRVVSPSKDVQDRAMVGDYKSVEVELQDESFRLAKKICGSKIGVVSGEKFKDVVGRTCHGFGIPSEFILIDGVPFAEATDDTILYEEEGAGTGQGNLGLSPSYTMGAIAWLDKLCELRGDWTWSITTEGKINFHSKPSYTAPADFILRRDPEDPHDYIANLSYRRSVQEFVNVVYAVTADAEKAREGVATTDLVEQEWRDVDSIIDEGNRYYVGDVWEDVIVLSDKQNADVELARRKAESFESVETVSFETRGRKLFAGDFVESRIGNFDVPPGTILVVAEEVRTLVADENEQRHDLQLTCVVHTIGQGEAGNPAVPAE